MSENYSSVSDLTLVTSDLSTFAISWTILEDESLSDHNYIMFKTEITSGKLSKKLRELVGHINRTNTNGMPTEKKT